MFSIGGQPEASGMNRGRRLTRLLLQSYIPRFAKGHFTHDVERHIIELLDNVDPLFPILALDVANYIQELIGPAYQDVFVQHQIGNAESKAEHPPHTGVLLLVTFVDNVHRVVDLWCEEPRVLFHRWNVVRAKAIYNLLSVMVIET